MQVILPEAAMGPHNAGAIAGIRSGPDPASITLVAAVGIVLSIPPLPLWHGSAPLV